MKAEINNENKAKFFAQYWGQKIVAHKFIGAGSNASIGSVIFSKLDNWHLELKPISDISDEDAIEVAKIIFKNPAFHTSDKGKRYIRQMILLDHEYNQLFFSFIKVSAVIDFLRSRGYLAPWMDLSCKELIKSGWVKLKEV